MTLARRLHARFPCRLACRVHAGAKPVEGALVNISMGGALLSVKGELRGPGLDVEVDVGRSVFRVRARLVRSIGADPSEKDRRLYGIEFGAGDATREKVRLIVDRIRSSGATNAPPLSRYWD